MLHQLLQWHHLLISAGYPADSVRNLEINTFWDGVFHSGTYILMALGVFVFWRHARREHGRWSWKLLPACLLIGWGIFNVVEGLVNHQILGLHHVNETVPRAQWIYWDAGCLIWGAAMAVAGWGWLSHLRRGREVNPAARPPRS